jgi:hypothetical protein
VQAKKATQGHDIEISVPVRIDEVGLRAKIEVPTIDGRALLKIPQGTLRERMEEKQRQIEQFVTSLNTELNQRSRPMASSQPGNSLIPVIEMRRPKKSGT